MGIVRLRTDEHRWMASFGEGHEYPRRLPANSDKVIVGALLYLAGATRTEGFVSRDEFVRTFTSPRADWTGEDLLSELVERGFVRLGANNQLRSTGRATAWLEKVIRDTG